jgi:glycosyltransferase 2 family protein
LSIGLIAFVLRKVNWSALGAILRDLHPGWALAGWACTLILILGLALRWRIFLRRQDFNVPFKTVFALTWSGQFFNSLLPGSTGGDVVKIFQLCRLFPDRKATAVATVFVDRLIASLALVLLASTAFVINPAPLRLLPLPTISIPALLGWSLAALALLAAVAWLCFRALRLTHWRGRFLRTMAATTESLVFNRGLLLAAFLALAIHTVNFLIAYLFARALGLTITPGQILLMMPVVLFLVMLPVTINGHGLRELLFIGYFTEMGIAVQGHPESPVREIAIAFSLLLVTNDLLWSLPGGAWYLIRFKAPAPISKPAAQELG